MTTQDYIAGVKDAFSKSVFVPELQAEYYYEEKFEMKWLATKLKQFSFIRMADSVTLETIESYTTSCLSYALKEYKGLPRGFQNGVVSYSVLVSENVDEQAIKFAMKRPKKHFSAFELPVIVDLSRNKLYYYEQTPMWGSLYYKYFREYIVQHFSV